jgi:predicted permease
LWQQRFGGDPAVLNRTVLLNGHTFTIVGVAPAGFTGPQFGATRDLYVPMMMQAVVRPPRAAYSGEMDPDLLKVRGNNWLFAIARLNRGVTKEQTETALGGLATASDRALQPEAKPHRIMLQWIDDGMPGQRAQIVPVARLLLGVVAAVLLIASANVANLLLARAAARRREVAVRLAIGASRWRLVRQFLAESVLLAVAGGALGVVVAWLTVIGLRAAPPPPGALPVAVDFAIDWRVLAFTLVLAIGTGLLFGLAPALRASRPVLTPSLKDESFVPDERSRRFGLRRLLVVSEVALALALLLAAGLFIRSLRASEAVNAGFDRNRLVNVPLSVNLLRYTRAQGRAFYQAAIDRAQALPGVEHAAVARVSVVSGLASVRSLHIEGRQHSSDVFRSDGSGFGAAGRNDAVNANVVSPGYFATLGIAQTRGRDFGAADTESSTPTVIVNERFVERHFPGANPLGARLSLGGPTGPWLEIVGIVATSKYASLLEPPTSVVYLPLSQNHETGVTLHVRTSVAPGSLLPALRREINALEPNLPLPNMQAMEDAIATSLYSARMGAWLLAVFGGLALLLATIGVYGVLAFSMARRTRELGIRLALGAQARDVFGLVVREGLWLVLSGVAIGLVGAIFGARALAQFLYGVSTFDRVAFVAAPAVLIVVALIACLIPARRAMKVNPTIALRTGP